MTAGALIIERVWSSPESSAFFLERCEIYIQIRNRSGVPIIIEKIECPFHVDPGVEPYTPFITPHLTLDHDRLSRPQRVVFDANLAIEANTNYYGIVIHYRDKSNEVRTFSHNPQKYIIFTPLGPCESHFFISHKDPQDTSIGKQLAHFLRKVGFNGYLSEDDHRPGIDLWKDKIPLAIQDSVGVIILWTTKASREPEKIYREIKIAKSFKRPLILAREHGVRVPDIFPKKKIEYYKLEKPISASQLIKLSCSIEDIYSHGGYS